MTGCGESAGVLVEQCTPVGKGRVRISMDSGESCLLYRGECRRLRMEEGRLLSETEYETLMTELLGKRARRRALHLLESMDRSERKLRELLARSEYPSRCIDEAVAYVKALHYLDDERYARNFVRYRQERMNRFQLEQKLMAKGINRTVALRALEEEYRGDEEEQIGRLLAKRHFDPEQADRREFARTYQFLIRRGFKSSQVLRQMRDEQ